MQNLVTNMGNTLSALMYYLNVAVSAITKNRTLMTLSILTMFLALVNPSLRLGKLLSFSAKR